MLKLLAANPGVQRTLRAELLRVLPSGEERAPTLDELSPSSAPCEFSRVPRILILEAELNEHDQI